MKTTIIDMSDLSFEDERDLMLKHMGKVVSIPYYIFPYNMLVSKNLELGKKYVTIACYKNCKTDENSKISYSYEFDLS